MLGTGLDPLVPLPLCPIPDMPRAYLRPKKEDATA